MYDFVVILVLPLHEISLFNLNRIMWYNIKYMYYEAQSFYKCRIYFEARILVEEWNNRSHARKTSLKVFFEKRQKFSGYK